MLHDKLLYVGSSRQHTKASYAGLSGDEFGYRRIERSNQTINLQGSIALVFNFLSLSLTLRAIQ